MKLKYILLIAGVWSAGMFASSPFYGQTQQKAAEECDGAYVRSIVEYLASDELAGRYPGTKGDTLASGFILEKFRSFGLESSLMPFGIKKEGCTTFNVAGILKGKEDRYIIVGAHYDHLGYGGKGSGSRTPDTLAVHNGADDNASGVSAVIKLARIYSGRGVPPVGLVFAAFGAEEKGVIGSKEFAENPPVPREKILAMFNFDMVGNLRNGSVSLGGTGTAKGLDSLIDRAKELYPGLRIAKSKDGVGPSDHTSFYAKNIPVLYFSTGATMDYHTPADDASKLNYKGIDSVVCFASELLDIVSAQPALEFTESGSANAAPMRASFKVTLGLMPDVTGQVENGLRADVVIKGKPAHNAGMKNGDIITEINGMAVKDIEGYMKCLGTLKAGEKAKIKIKRGDEELILDVQL